MDLLSVKDVPKYLAKWPEISRHTLSVNQAVCSGWQPSWIVLMLAQLLWRWWGVQEYGSCILLPHMVSWGSLNSHASYSWRKCGRWLTNHTNVETIFFYVLKFYISLPFIGVNDSMVITMLCILYVGPICSCFSGIWSVHLTKNWEVHLIMIKGS